MESQPTLFAQSDPVTRAALWRERVKLVLFVVFCVELGMVLLAYPWTSFWNENTLLYEYPRLAIWLTKGWVKGMISGLGVVDIWIGVWQATQYRERQ